jgi:hypothetical protein
MTLSTQHHEILRKAPRDVHWSIAVKLRKCSHNPATMAEATYYIESFYRTATTVHALRRDHGKGSGMAETDSRS